MRRLTLFRAIRDQTNQEILKKISWFGFERKALLRLATAISLFAIKICNFYPIFTICSHLHQPVPLG